MTVAIRPVVQRSVSKSQAVAPRRRRRGSCRCCAAVNFGGRPGAGFAVKAWRPRRRTASRQRITELCEHPSRRATSVTEAPAFSSSIPRRRRRSSSSGLPGGRMPQEYRAMSLLVVADGMFLLHRTRIADLAARRRLPAIYGLREFVDAGGLMVYGASLRENFRRAATYVDKIFKGAKPADLPVEQPTKFELVINRRTAKTLGLTIPPTILL